MIIAKITAGIFFISPIVLIPIPMEQTPKINDISALNFELNLCPANAPAIPPSNTEAALIRTPIGINNPPFI